MRGARRARPEARERSDLGERRLRIALIADPYLPVPPLEYGGIERVIAMLAERLVARGHRVTLFAAPGSWIEGEVVSYGVVPHVGVVPRVRELVQVAWPLWRRRHEFDLVHSFGRLAALLPLLPLRLPKVQSYQRQITPRSVRWGARLGRGSIVFTSCSTAMRREVDHLGRWYTVFNGAPASRFSFSARVAADAPLVFLGRVERIKGPHTAIQVARMTRRALVIAGNVPVEHRPFFASEIEPFLDGEGIRYVGPVDDAAKNRLLGSAAALLMPVEWEEPFGIVMAEALACGTPVIGLRRGAVPEVVEHGVTGFVCDTQQEMIEAVGRLDAIDRGACRQRFERWFSDDVIAQRYEAIYRELVAARRC